jgi:hypothetical protein
MEEYLCDAPKEISEVEIVLASCTVEWVAAYGGHIPIVPVITFEGVHVIIARARD